MKRIFSSLILLFFCSNPVISQNPDSLWNVYLDKTQADSNRAKAVNEVAAYYTNNNPDTAIILAHQALKFCVELRQKKHEARAHNSLGISYSNKGEYGKAIEHHQEALKLRKEIKDLKAISISYNNIGIVYYSQANYPKALEFYLKALKIKEELKDKKGIGVSFNNIAVVYYLQKNFAKAMEYHFKALKIREEIGDKTGISASYNNIGNVYMDQKNFLKALEYYFKSLKIAEELNNKKSLGDDYNNISGVYAEMKDYKKAIEYENKAIAIREEIGDKYGLSTSYGAMGLIFDRLSDHGSSIKYHTLSLKLAKDIGAIEQERKAYQKLADSYEKQGNFKEAYKNHKKFKELTDSIYNSENSKQLGDLKTNFEVEKKETELKIKAEAEKKTLKAISAEEKKQQQIIIAAVLGALLIVIVFSFFLYKRFRLTERQKNIIQEQKGEVERQKTLVEVKQKEIVDSINYAKRIQQAILPPSNFIQNYFPDNFIYYRPKDIVAGDFYWMEHIGDLIFVAAADSTGHGVPGAMVSVVCSNALNRSVKEFGLTETGKILDKTRELVLETFAKSGEEIKDGMDISLLKFERSGKSIRSVQWSGANNPLYYTVNDKLKDIKPDKQPIGNVDNAVSFTTHEVQYSGGMVFYLLTDGYQDQFGGEKGKKFKIKQLEKLFLDIHNQPLTSQKKIIEKTFNQWKGNLEQVDDVTIIGIRA
jgi:tetratricopeptide (TPR) repeat protein/serine phosphatase RsbU (regulator of sigma subunit)